jgi:hypothetical protein
MLNCCPNRVWRIGHLPNAAPQMPDALGGMRSGKATALRGWTRCGITETLRALITLKGPQWFERTRQRMGADKQMRRCRLSAYRLSIR